MKFTLISRPKIYIAIRILQRKTVRFEPILHRETEYLMLGRLYKRHTYRVYVLQIEIVRTAKKIFTDN